MRTDTPAQVRLADYAPYPFKIPRVALTISLDPKETQVTALLSIERAEAGGTAPLRLDGEHLNLKRLAVNGRTLAPGEFEIDETGLTLAGAPDAFTLETVVEIAPEANTALSGLYMSGGRFCSQCEAEGFRRITYWPDRPDVMSRFHVRVEGDAAREPVLLSNGTPAASGALAEGRHFAEWDDPWPKPSYLFALCAGTYDVLRDTFTTCSGRRVDLAIHVDPGEASRAGWAMDCLKRSMRWDEEVYGREYDLDAFNIVAVRDFNFGAMENKGLNIFNSAYVLADETTATDIDFEAIESIVAHEYFHNWTGNRITCRDWFQLCLKEGLTVFRDQDFSADMRSAPVQRIKDVTRLRARQFPEDAGPLAHPVRPQAFASIDNLYTATVYEKGAELIRALKTLIGADAFARGMALYFERFDGMAATIEHFYSCFEEAAGRDLAAFRAWYDQPGTPEVRVRETWDAATGTLTIGFTQVKADTPDGRARHYVPIPVACALIGEDGAHLEAEGWPGGERLIVLEGYRTRIAVTLGKGAARPHLSVLRGFSAPVRLARNLPQSARRQLAVLESDPVSQWDLVQSVAREEILRLANGGRRLKRGVVDMVAEAVERAAPSDPAFAALLMRLPETGETFLACDPGDPVALEDARRTVHRALALRLAEFGERVLFRASAAPFRPDAEQAGERALRAQAIAGLGARGQDHRILALYESAPNMTEQLACLRALAEREGEAREAALSGFYDQWADNPLIIDKWFAVQAATGTLDQVEALTRHPAFDLKNPNRVRAVAGVFAIQNLARFHDPGGRGHRLLADIAEKVDRTNPAIAARLLTGFEQWRRLTPEPRESAAATLRRLKSLNLSKNAADIVARAAG